MNSPFPGMDPYIEACGLWRDFHLELIAEIKRALARAAPERYLVRAEERYYVVLVEEAGKVERPFYPDVSVIRQKDRKGARKKGSTAVAELVGDDKPISMQALIQDEHREAFIEIYEAKPEQRLVTSIEVLSPSNKDPGTPGWDQYHRKRQSHLLGDVNLVEIDLLRGGQRMPMVDPWPDSPYRLLVAPAKRWQRCDVWLAHFQRPLPVIPVPLAKPDPDIPLDLQPMIAAIYQRSRYDQSIDYTRPLTPPLKPEEVEWLEKRLREGVQ